MSCWIVTHGQDAHATDGFYAAKPFLLVMKRQKRRLFFSEAFCNCRGWLNRLFELSLPAMLSKINAALFLVCTASVPCLAEPPPFPPTEFHENPTRFTGQFAKMAGTADFCKGSAHSKKRSLKAENPKTA